MIASVLMSLGIFLAGLALFLLMVGLLCVAGLGGWKVYTFLSGEY